MNHERLIQNLEAQAMGYRAMLEALEAEAMLPASCTVADIVAIQQEKEKAVNQVKVLEQERQRVAQEMSLAAGMTAEAKLDELLPLCDPLGAVRLMDLKRELLLLVDHINPLARENAEKAQVRANCFVEVEDNLHRVLKRTSLYSKTGKVRPKSGSVFFNRSV